MNGTIFEKVGVNVSTVGGTFAPEFAVTILGAQDDPRFFATGISLVAHMANPHVPAVHMNLRFLGTTKRWFGGGADLNPAIPNDDDTAAFHARLRAACAAHDPTFTRAFQSGRRSISGFPTAMSRAASGAFSSTISKAISTPISRSRATSAKRCSTFSPRSCASA